MSDVWPNDRVQDGLLALLGSWEKKPLDLHILLISEKIARGPPRREFGHEIHMLSKKRDFV